MIAKTKPKFEADGVTLSFGMYPQSKIEDESLLVILNGLTRRKHPAFEDKGIVTYDNKFYLVSTHYKGGKSEDSHFLFAPIRWKVLDLYGTGKGLALCEKKLRRLPMQEKAADKSSFFADMLARYNASSATSSQPLDQRNFCDYDLGTWVTKGFVEQAFGENAKLLASIGGFKALCLDRKNSSNIAPPSKTSSKPITPSTKGMAGPRAAIGWMAIAVTMACLM